jgi:hypothetical protein
MVKHACRIVQYVAIELAEGDDGLEGIAKRVIGCDERSGKERKWAPESL